MKKIYSDTTLATNVELQQALESAGWEYQSACKKRGGHTTHDFRVFTREIRKPTVETGQMLTENFCQQSQLEKCEHQDFLNGGKFPSCTAEYPFAPATLSNIPSVARMQSDKQSLVIALDTEFYYNSKERCVLTWQLAFVLPDKPDTVQEIIFCSPTSKTLSVDFMLAWLFEHFGLGESFDYRNKNYTSMSVTLLCHTGKADLSTFNWGFDLLKHLSDIQGGLVTLRNISRRLYSLSHPSRFYPITLTVRDTLCFAPAGQRSLEALGETIGIPKIDVSKDDKNDMLSYLFRDPINFAEYAINDSVITLCYVGNLWGYNKAMPVSVPSASVKAAVPSICNYFGIDDDNLRKLREEYNKTFRGLHTVKKGLTPKQDKAGFLENTSLSPVSDNARILQTYAQNAYHGGYNGSSVIGYFDDEETHDFDLENAYPTCMSLVPDVDWSGDVLANEIVRRNISLQDFHSPFDLVFGYIKFRFPDSVEYPCIPVSVDGSMVFPRSSDGLNGVYASAPEIYLALRLGAEVWAEHAYVGKYLYRKNGSVSFSLSSAVKQLVADRKTAQKMFGKKSLPDLLLKTAVNSLYGKTAQDLLDKCSWSAYNNTMVNIGCSELTSPTHACLTTAGVRCVLLAAMNQLTALGYKIFSVTTDGFITNAPENVLRSLDLFGFADFFKSARKFLTDDETMWAEKHHQNDLLNFTTRGNVSLSPDGVCAHNSYVSGYIKDSYEDRLDLMTKVLGRTDCISCATQKWSGFRALAASFDKRKDFFVENQIRRLSMDFDLKRKPIKNSFYTVSPIIKGTIYEIANFETEPYNTVDEYVRYKTIGKSSKVLRTVSDWELYFCKITDKKNEKQHRYSDLNWSILFTCIMGYRLGLWDIPYLNRTDLTVEEKVAWINEFNKSTKTFKTSNWKDCRKHDRASQMIDHPLVSETLKDMQNFSFDHLERD